jgi:hypothetical protein
MESLPCSASASGPPGAERVLKAEERIQIVAPYRRPYHSAYDVGASDVWACRIELLRARVLPLEVRPEPRIRQSLVCGHFPHPIYEVR